MLNDPIWDWITIEYLLFIDLVLVGFIILFDNNIYLSI